MPLPTMMKSAQSSTPDAVILPSPQNELASVFHTRAAERTHTTGRVRDRDCPRLDPETGGAPRRRPPSRAPFHRRESNRLAPPLRPPAERHGGGTDPPA